MGMESASLGTRGEKMGVIFRSMQLTHPGSGVWNCLQVVELQGCKLHITHYYSVLTDGVVCIPWDFHQR